MKMYLMIAGITVTCLMGCAALPDNAPVEFAQARDEIAQAQDEKVDDMFGNTIARAKETLDQSVELYEASAEYKDPATLGQKKQEATEGAVKARNLASNAREAYRQVNSWDADITNFTEKKALSSRLGEVEEVVKGSAAKEQDRSQPQSQLSMTTAVAFFDSGESQLNSENRERVAEIAHALKSNPRLEAWVIGYTDPTGSPETNERLAIARSQAVAQELISNGVKDDQVQVRPHAATTSSNAKVRGKGHLQLQRKVEVRLVPSSRQAE